MLLKLALKNIREEKFPFILGLISITIASTTLLLFLGISSSIKNTTFAQLEKSNPLSQITIHKTGKKSSLTSFFLGLNNQKITPAEIAEIKKITGVKRVFAEINYTSVASVEINALGLDLISDSMIFGLETDFIKESLAESAVEKWQNPDREPYPVLIPRRILELYNLTLAPSQNLPQIDEKKLIGKEITLYPNFSSFFPDKGGKEKSLKLEIAGFSDTINLGGITLPAKTVTELNEKFGEKFGGYLQVYVIAQSPEKTVEIAKELEKKGYQTQYFQKNFRDIEAKINYLSITLGLIAGIIFLLAGLAVIGIFLARISEKTKEFGLYYILGADKRQVKTLILSESFIMGFLGSIMAILLNIILQKIFLQIIENDPALESISSNIIFFPAQNIFLTIFFTLTLTLLASYIPAHKAANTSAISALR